MTRLFSSRRMGMIVLMLLLVPAATLLGCKGSVDDEGASLDVPPDAQVD